MKTHEEMVAELYAIWNSLSGSDGKTRLGEFITAFEPEPLAVVEGFLPNYSGAWKNALNIHRERQNHGDVPVTVTIIKRMDKER